MGTTVKQKVVFMQGLPGSGKSTFAKEELVDKLGFKRVNKDDLRAMLDNGKWTKDNEKTINEIQETIILALIAGGHSVVIDNTHIFGNHIDRITGLIRGSGYTDIDISTHFMDTPLSVCIARDSSRQEPFYVGRKVIRQMYEAVKDKYIAKYKYNPDLPEAIIVDIDGTLAHMTDRSPYDYTKVLTDSVDEVVRELVQRYQTPDPVTGFPGVYTLIVSGRDDSCKEDTIKWLNDNGIKFDELHMRDMSRVDETGKKIDDRIIKREIFDKWIRNRYNIRFVLDDRNRVVEMWRSLGLKVLQVGEGDF